MRGLIAVCLLAAGCGARHVEIDIPTKAVSPGVDFSRVMRINGRWGVGHACPVAGEVFTAVHNVEPFKEQPDRWVRYAWEDQAGNKGILQPSSAALARDAARMTVMRVMRGSPRYYELASREPVEGETVSWLEYDRFLRPVERTAKAVHSFAGLIQFDEAPNPGSSGGCLFNSVGQVVGVVIWRTGVATSLVGEWRP